MWSVTGSFVVCIIYIVLVRSLVVMNWSENKFSDSRPKLVAGSADGYFGHVDGRLREAKMNHPKGLTVDDKGNIYVADTDNMAIRKISDTGNLVIYIFYM